MFRSSPAMSDKKEQVKPLAPAAHRLDINDDRPDAFSVEIGSHLCRRRQNCIKLCGCSAAVLLIAVTIVLVLMFTVFHVKDPSLKINSVNIKGVDGLNRTGTTNDGPGRNMTFDFDVSVKNPNVASFKFTNTTTYVYYDGSLVGEATGRTGEARARKRLAMDVSVGVIVDKIMKVERLKTDLSVGVLSISSYMRISGKVKIASAIKKKIVVKMNCTMNLSVWREKIEDLICS